MGGEHLGEAHLASGERVDDEHRGLGRRHVHRDLLHATLELLECSGQRFAVADQAREVEKAKRAESGMILGPVTVRPSQSLREALGRMLPGEAEEALDDLVAALGALDDVLEVAAVFGVEIDFLQQFRKTDDAGERVVQFVRDTGNEFAGACFSPDGSTLFVNAQSPGITFASFSLPRRLIDASRSWHDDFLSAVSAEYGEEVGTVLGRRYVDSFPEAYKEDFNARTAATSRSSATSSLSMHRTQSCAASKRASWTARLPPRAMVPSKPL